MDLNELKKLNEDNEHFPFCFAISKDKTEILFTYRNQVQGILPEEIAKKIILLLDSYLT